MSYSFPISQISLPSLEAGITKTELSGSQLCAYQNSTCLLYDAFFSGLASQPIGQYALHSLLCDKVRVEIERFDLSAYGPAAIRHAGPKLAMYSTGKPTTEAANVHFAQRSRRLMIRTASQTQNAAKATPKIASATAMPRL